MLARTPRRWRRAPSRMRTPNENIKLINLATSWQHLLVDDDASFFATGRCCRKEVLRFDDHEPKSRQVVVPQDDDGLVHWEVFPTKSAR